MVLSILLGVYIISFLAAYKYMQIAHGENGRWGGLSTGVEEMAITLLPLVNTLFAIIGWVRFYPYKRGKTNNFNKFFKIKKP